MHGEADRVDDKYIKKCATKALITWRHVLNKALDIGDGKPPELNVKYWEELQRIQESEESKRKSVQMGNQARKRGLRNSTKEKIKQSAVMKLISEWQVWIFLLKLIILPKCCRAPEDWNYDCYDSVSQKEWVYM